MITTVMVILLLLAIGTGIGFVVAGRLARQRRHSLEKALSEQEAIVSEERRLFSFLHSLGDATTHDSRESALHRLIVEGAMKVTGSKGGALYAFDEGRKSLVPRYCSDQCAPLIDLNEKVLSQAEANPSSLLSTMRWQAVAASSGMLGGVFSSQKAEHIANLGDHAQISNGTNPHQQNVTVMIGPLSSGDRRLGVLAVTADNDARTFSQNDIEVFGSLVEQSAFALANATAHQEVQSKRQLEAELKTAGDVQRILLPDGDPVIDGFVIAGRNRPSRILSGDFYDYLQPTPRHFGAVIADVSGKGLPAALIAASTRSALQAHALSKLSPAAVLNLVNRQICPDIRTDMFISMIYMVFEQGSPVITLARAGHPNPYVWRKSTGVVETIHSHGLGIGIDDGDVFERVTKDCEVTLEPGDMMLLYTDGVNEAVDADGDEFGEERISKVLAQIAPQGARAVVDQLMEALNAFVGGKASNDDVTLIALQKL